MEPVNSLIIIFIVIHFIDVPLTHKILKNGGHEYNPIAKFLYKKWSVWGLLLLKLITAPLFALYVLNNIIDVKIIFIVVFMYGWIVLGMALDFLWSQMKLKKQCMRTTN